MQPWRLDRVHRTLAGPCVYQQHVHNDVSPGSNWLESAKLPVERTTFIETRPHYGIHAREIGHDGSGPRDFTDSVENAVHGTQLFRAQAGLAQGRIIVVSPGAGTFRFGSQQTIGAAYVGGVQLRMHVARRHDQAGGSE